MNALVGAITTIFVSITYGTLILLSPIFNRDNYQQEKNENYLQK